MTKITLTAGIAVALGTLTAEPAARAPLLELDSCHDDLDRLRRTASDASDAAEDAKSKFDEFEDCRRDPELQDLLGNGSRSRRSDYESALHREEGGEEYIRIISARKATPRERKTYEEGL